MEKKRKRDNSEEEIKRKIRKLERKLLNKTKNRRIIYSSEDSDGTLNNQPEGSPPARELSPLSVPVHVAADNESPSPSSPSPPPSLPPSPPPITAIQGISTETEIVIEETALDEDILQLLGEAPKPDIHLGPSIHKDVANRWQEILAKGLPKDIKEKILDEYLIPSNCDLLIAPTLNPEAKAALADPLVKRVNFLMQKQKQLGIALSALANATSLILSNETSKQKLLKPISDACRILCDNHFVETKSRRNLVISSTNMQLKDTLIESVRDKSWLFGENVSEKLKAAKSIQKSGDELKNQPKAIARSNYQNKNNRGRLNYKPPHRKTDNKPVFSNNSGRGRHQARAQQRGTQRNYHRSSPPRRSTHK